MTKLEKCIDLICDQINAAGSDCADVVVLGAFDLVYELEEAFTRDGEVMTCEAVFGDAYHFCWGKTKDLHKAWVAAH